MAARYEVRNFIVLVQRQWGARNGWHKTLRSETIKGCAAKLMTTGSVNDKRRSGRPFTSPSAEKVERVQEMFMRSLQKSTHPAARKSRQTRHIILSVLHKELSYH